MEEEAGKLRGQASGHLHGPESKILYHLNHGGSPSFLKASLIKCKELYKVVLHLVKPSRIIPAGNR